MKRKDVHFLYRVKDRLSHPSSLIILRFVLNVEHVSAFGSLGARYLLLLGHGVSSLVREFWGKEWKAFYDCANLHLIGSIMRLNTESRPKMTR